MEDKSIAEIKVKTTDLCVKCNKELKTTKTGGLDLFGMGSTGSGAFYCENKECDFFGYLTLARVPHTEKIVELNKETPTT